MTLDNTIRALSERGDPITLDALGGIDSVTQDDTKSALFPLVAQALVDDWGSLTSDGQQTAVNLIVAGLAATGSGIALNDTCLVVVPAAPGLDITYPIKEVLHSRLKAPRTDQKTGSLAAIAFRWLAHLAVLSDDARPALTDILTGVARNDPEPMPFAVAAAQVAGLTYDHWRDTNATDCLGRLIETDGRADAWFALGQTRLVDALEADTSDSCLNGLRSTLECFDNAANTGEQRPDAVMYSNAVRFVTEWAADATADMLADHHTAASKALQDYMLAGHGLPDQPMWIRPRYEAENAWIELVHTMNVAAEPGPPGQPWYDASIAIGALAEAYRASNSFRPRRTNNDHTAVAFPNLVAPRLNAPFVEDSVRLAYVNIWLAESDDPDAEAFSKFVQEHALERVVPPKARPSGPTRR